MAFVNFFPLGIVQLYYAVDIGYWYARSLAFLDLRWSMFSNGRACRETLYS